MFQTKGSQVLDRSRDQPIPHSFQSERDAKSSDEELEQENPQSLNRRKRAMKKNYIVDDENQVTNQEIIDSIFNGNAMKQTRNNRHQPSRKDLQEIISELSYQNLQFKTNLNEILKHQKKTDMEFYGVEDASDSYISNNKKSLKSKLVYFGCLFVILFIGYQCFFKTSSSSNQLSQKNGKMTKSSTISFMETDQQGTQQLSLASDIVMPKNNQNLSPSLRRPTSSDSFDDSSYMKNQFEMGLMQEEQEITSLLTMSSKMVIQTLQSSNTRIASKYYDMSIKFYQSVIDNLEDGYISKDLYSETGNYNPGYYPTFIEENDFYPGITFSNSENSVHMLRNLLNGSYEEIKSWDVEDYVTHLKVVNNYIVVACEDEIYAYDRLNYTKEGHADDLRTSDIGDMFPVRYDSGEAVLIVGEKGYIQILDVPDFSELKEFQLSDKVEIYQMSPVQKRTNDTVFALGTESGLRFVYFAEDSFTFVESDEIYLKGSTIRSFVDLGSNLIAVAVMYQDTDNVQLINRTSGTIIKTVSTNTEYSLELQSLPGFNITTYPYLVLRESSQVTLVDIANENQYSLLTGLEYSYFWDWLDGEYYDWVYQFMAINTGSNAVDGQWFDIALTTSSDGKSSVQKFRFNEDFIDSLKYMQMNN